MSRSRQPSRAYSAMFSGLLFGSLFLGAGLAGYRLDNSMSMNAVGRWTGEVILWQVLFGIVMLIIGIVAWRRLAGGGWTIGTGAPGRLKQAGSGQSSGARPKSER